MFKDNLRQGKGKMLFHTGDVYQGNFVDDQMQGQGLYTWVS
jgi:hypothetical protein